MNFWKKKFYPLFVLGMMAFILFAFIPPGLAQTPSPVIVRVVPDQAEVEISQVVEIAVAVQDVVDVYAIDLLLAYDPQAVEVVDMDPDLDGVQVQLGAFLDPGFVITNIADNDLGRLRLAMTQLNPSTPKSGSGNLIVVRFNGKTLKAATEIELISVKLANPYGSYIDVGETKNGLLSVVAEIQGPNSTSIPAQAAGTPLPTATFTSSPPGAQTNPIVASATNALLFIQPTTTLILPPPATATAGPTQTPEVLESAPATEILQSWSSPTPVLLAETDLDAQEKASELTNQKNAPAATSETPQRRFFSGGEIPQTTTGEQGSGISPLWAIPLFILLAAGVWFYWMKTH